MKTLKITGTALALSAALAFTVAPVVATASSSAMVKCYGTHHSCKHSHHCKSGSTSCKKHSHCKGKGYVKTTEQKCMKMGGHVK